MTRSELLSVVYRFNPRGMHVFTFGYDDTQEAQRQREIRPRAVAGYPAWDALLDRLRARYRVGNHSERILGASYLEGRYDPAYSADVQIPGHRIGFHVCLLGPYYGIRRLGVPGEEPAARDLAQEIEATYPGHQPIPPELGNEVVPDVGVFGKTTIYDCLFSDAWESSSGPWPPERPPPPSEADVAAEQATRSARLARLWARGYRWGRRG